VHRIALASLTVIATAAGAAAQAWPQRPVTMIVPYAAGGPVDTVGRISAARLSEILGQQVVIENIGGAGGMTGSARAAKAAPDGYTFLLGSLSTLAMNQLMYKSPLYDGATDFAPVALFADSARVLIARKDFPATTLPEFVAYAKANQDKMQYGSAGGGSGAHVCAILLNLAMGTDRITHVPYRGTGPAMQDLIAGRIDFNCEQISTALPQIQAGNVKAIATLGPGRVSALPDLGTAKEQGLGDIDCSSWSAFVFPKGTPADVVDKLAVATNQMADTPAVRDRFETVGVTIAPPERRSTEYLASFIRSEIAKWTAPIRASGVKLD
jgi:tripartite-type tricarboxylate transporter receptor subunit TctC